MTQNADGSFDAIGSDTPRGAHRFFQFNLRQVLLLVALCGVLLVIMTPRIRQAFHWRRLRAESDQRAVAEAELRSAVRANNVIGARRALEAGADPNLVSTINSMVPQGPRLLSTCIVNGQLEMVELLLEFGADLEHVDRVVRSISGPMIDGSPLFIALRCDQPPEIRCKMVRLLVAHGANPRSKDGHLNPMDIAVHLSDAQVGDLLREYGLSYGPREMAAFNRLDELQPIVEQSPEILKERFPTTWAGQRPTLLGIALRGGYREMALFLIESGAPLDTIEHQGSTLLHEAARGGDPELIRLLVARGLDVNATDDYGDTPLCDIAGRKKPQAVAALIEAGADVNRQGISGRTPLHGAVYGGRVDVVKMLLGAGADPTLRDSKGETPLDLARTRSPKIAGLLEQATFAKVPHDDD